MIQLDKKIDVKINILSLATLIAGIYTTHTQVSVFAIPTELFIEVVDKLIPYLKHWDYSKMSLEDWVTNNLLVYPIDMFSQVEYEEAKYNDIFIERRYGNVTLIATAMVIFD